MESEQTIQRLWLISLFIATVVTALLVIANVNISLRNELQVLRQDLINVEMEQAPINFNYYVEIQALKTNVKQMYEYMESQNQKQKAWAAYSLLQQSW